MPVVAGHPRLSAQTGEIAQGIRELEVTVQYENPELWRQWVSVSSSATTTINVTWSNWTGTTVSTYGTSAAFYAPPVQTTVRPPLTDEQRAELEAAHERRAAAAEEWRRTQEAREAAATERALETLTSLLNEEQRESYRILGFFDMTAQSGRRYRLHRGVAGNVRELGINPEGEPEEVASLCCHPSRSIYDEETGRRLGEMPVEDVVVSQLLALRFDEERFRLTANISQHVRRRRLGSVPLAA